jgi:hypothetical protein
LRERVKIDTRVRAVELRTNCGVRVLIDIAKLGFDRDIPVRISATNEMLGNYADLGISAWYRKIHDFFAALKVSRYSGIGERRTKRRHRQEQKLR